MATGSGIWQGSLPVGGARRILARTFDDQATDLKPRLTAMYSLLAALNVGAWIWALIAFGDRPTLLGMALLVYGLGLRHAVDADHIAAIDNVTRKLLGENKRPVAVGFFFAMGHSAVVVLVGAAISATTSMLGTFRSLEETGGAISTVVSAVFLFAVAAMNLFMFLSIWRTYRKVQAGDPYVAEDLDLLLNSRGILARIFRPLFRLVTKSWHMFPLGFLFGLGFDTATEVAMFGLSATQAAEGVPLHTILVFPLLFAAGMSLVDTIDGVLMFRAYDWASVEPVRKLRYNLVITILSVLLAIVIGSVEVMGLMLEKYELSGGFWNLAGRLHDNVKDLGFAFVGVFLAVWALYSAIHHARQFRLAGPVPGRRS